MNAQDICRWPRLTITSAGAAAFLQLWMCLTGVDGPGKASKFLEEAGSADAQNNSAIAVDFLIILQSRADLIVVSSMIAWEYV